MNRLLMTAAVVASFLASVAPERARAESSVDAGQKLALMVCSTCHVVGPDQVIQPTLVQHTPNFEEIANRPNTTAKSLRLFITTTHWDEKTIPMTMPNPMLIDEQAADVASYILSLRKHR